ncbi:MAG: hypothetical protein H6562_15550 [Lewinellaceae bacterium]|nr:hypothetical protein [Lewinella sp.]MCB9280308.1 hypothetical protein [Lewinellaceae bacterium]
MQQDRLEQFIWSNREAFDDASPGLRVWAQLERQLDAGHKRRFSPRSLLKYAAAVLLLLTAGAAIGFYLNNPKNQEQPLTASGSELSDLENYYNQQVDQKFAQLAKYNYDPTIKADLDQIDQAMLELKQELSVAPKGKEKEIIQRLIKSYQLKIQILEKMLDFVQPDEPSNETIATNEVSI